MSDPDDLPSPLPRTAKIAGYIAAIAGAVVAVGTMWSMFNLPVFSTRGYVDDKISTVAGTVIELAIDQRDRIKRGRDGLMARVTAATDPQSRADIQQLVDQANQDVSDVDARITALERLRIK